MNRSSYTKQRELECLQDATALLNSLRTASLIPHATVSYMLYRCRFCDRKKFRSLVSEFISLGYNPLRSSVSINEEICLRNIIARL